MTVFVWRYGNLAVFFSRLPINIHFLKFKISLQDRSKVIVLFRWSRKSFQIRRWIDAQKYDDDYVRFAIVLGVSYRRLGVHRECRYGTDDGSRSNGELKRKKPRKYLAGDDWENREREYGHVQRTCFCWPLYLLYTKSVSVRGKIKHDFHFSLPYPPPVWYLFILFFFWSFFF